MEALVSPDLPAYDCYLIVFIAGVFVALTHVNRLMGQTSSRWRFFSTWLVFFAYLAVPLLLFWFLDYSGVIHDTSLFAALIVAFGYRQIFAGQIQGMQLPGDPSRLWRPFEVWAEEVRKRIATKHALWQSRFDDEVRSHLANDPQRIAGLEKLVLFEQSDLAAMRARLAAIDGELAAAALPADEAGAVATHHRVRVLMGELRKIVPENYGYMIKQHGLIPRAMYWRLLGNKRAQITFAVVFFLVVLTAFTTCYYFFQPPTFTRYHQWRFGKANATERDRFRTREFLIRRLQSSSPTAAADVAAVLTPILRGLRYRGIEHRLADDILRLVVDLHSPQVNACTIPVLIEALRNEDCDVRLRIHTTLRDLQKADYLAQTLDKTLSDWTPSKAESPGAIDQCVSVYRAWWTVASVAER